MGLGDIFKATAFVLCQLNGEEGGVNNERN